MITILNPTGPGINVSDLFVTNGASPSFRCIQDIGGGYLSAAGVAEFQAGEIFTFDPLPDDFDDTINAVTIVLRIREVGSGARANLVFFSFQDGIPVQEDPPVDFLGVSVFTEYRLRYALADGLATWTPGLVNALQAGCVLLGEANEVQWDELHLEVEHVGCSREVRPVNLNVEGVGATLETDGAGPLVMTLPVSLLTNPARIVVERVGPTLKVEGCE